MNPCFPEPAAPDDTEARRTETTGSWLRRSSWVRAAQCRRFYNENLAALPAAAAESLCPRLHRERSQAAHFELVVGRFLQLLGAAELRHEVAGSEGRAVDWLARFPDGDVAVEATAPVVNAVVGDESRAAGPLLDLVQELTPRGWHPIVVHAPALGPRERLQPLRERLTTEFAQLPESEPGREVTVRLQLQNGEAEIVLLRDSDPAYAATQVGGPMVGYVDDTSEVVDRAVAGKRRQARGQIAPVLAALYTGGFGDHEVDKFDIALFGRTVAHMGRGELGFDPSGVFGRGSGEPTFAGALAFVALGWRGGDDPILYVHPRTTARLPAPLLRLRRRQLTDAGIVDVPTEQPPVLMEMGWPTD